MSTRETPEYKSMTPYHACEVAEGFGDGEGAPIEEQRAAWQYIYDTKLYRSLQGWYGRALQAFIDLGEIETGPLTK